MTDREVADRDPYTVAPTKAGRCFVEVHVGRPGVGDSQKEEGAEAEIIRRYLGAKFARRFKPARS